MKRIEEWYSKDLASGTFMKELSELLPTMKALLAELGLIKHTLLLLTEE